MADGDDADEGEGVGRAEGFGDGWRVGLRRAGDPTGTQAVRFGGNEKVLGGGRAVFHRTGGLTREDENAEGGVGDELGVAQELRNAGREDFSVTTTNSQGWSFMAVGARRAQSTISSMVARSTDSAV